MSLTKSEKKEIRSLFFIVFATLVILILCELFSFHYLDRYSKISKKEMFRMERPVAYDNSLYFSKRFIGESIDSGGIFYTPNGTRLILIKDKKGNFINVERGDRVTFPDIKGHNKLFIFGGSTVFSGEVPDYYTIPSLLSKLLEDNNKLQYKVLNKGVTSVNAKQQLNYLQKTKINRGDIVVFYSGVNDILQGLYFGNPDGTIIGQQLHIQTILRENSIDRFLSRFYTYKLLKTYANSGYTPRHLLNNQDINALTQKVSENYKASITKAKEYVEANGGYFVNILQPNLYSKNKNSFYEKWINKNINFVGLDKTFAIGNKVLKIANIDLKKSGVITFDFSNIFDDLEEECYLDGYHVTEICNLRTATRIYEALGMGSTNSYGRDYLNNVHKTYVSLKGMQYLYYDMKERSKSPIYEARKFIPENFYGEFDRNALKNNILKRGFVGFRHKPVSLYQTEITIRCEKNSSLYDGTNSIFISVGAENNSEKYFERFPLDCGSNFFNNKLDFKPSLAGLVIETKSDIYIDRIVIYEFVD